MRVFVYWNLHRNQWSVRHKGKVIDHTDCIVIKDAVFKVSEKGRQRVLREKRKNVHAGVEGEWITNCSPYKTEIEEIMKHPQIVRYNPYKYKTFVRLPEESPIYEAPFVVLWGPIPAVSILPIPSLSR